MINLKAKKMRSIELSDEPEKKCINVLLIRGYSEMMTEVFDYYCDNIDSNVEFNVVELYPMEIEEYLKNCETECLPDFIMADDISLQKYIAEMPEKFATFNDYIEPSLFASNAIENVSDIGENIYGCPFLSNVAALYYRKDKFEEYGIEMPEQITWEDFFRICEQMKSYLDYEYPGYMLPFDGYLPQIIMRSTGKLFYDENGQVSTENIYEILELFKRMQEMEILSPYYGFDNREIEELIGEDKLFLIIGLPYRFHMIKNLVKDCNLDQEWGVTNIPLSGNFSHNVGFPGVSWMVLNKDNPDETEENINILLSLFMENQDIPVSLAEKYDIVPVLNNLSDSLSGLDNNGCFSDDVIAFLAQLNEDIPHIKYYEKQAELLNKFVDTVCDVVLNDVPVEIGYDRLSKEIILFDPFPPLKELEIVQEPNKVIYYEWESFDSSGMIVRATFVDGSTLPIQPRFLDTKLYMGDTYIEISLTSCGVTKSVKQPITVLSRNLEYIEVQPRKDWFFYGDKSFIKSQIIVTAYYDNDTSREVDDFTLDFIFFDPESKNLTFEVKYSESTNTCSELVNFNVIRKLEEIRVQKPPTDITYKNQGYLKKEGMEILARYDNGDVELIDIDKIKIRTNPICFKNGERSTDVVVAFTDHEITCSDTLTVYRKKRGELDGCDILQDMGTSGCGYVNLSSGRLNYQFDDFVGTDTYFPIIISRNFSYNISKDYGVGPFWHLNVQQELVYKKTSWYYTDKLGQEHIFSSRFTASNGRSSIRNETLGLDLFEDNLNKTVKLIDRSNNTLLFKNIADVYRLTEMHQFPSKPENVIDAYSLKIKYHEDGRIDHVSAGKIINGNRPTVEFEYSESFLLKSLKYIYGTETTVVKYTYDSNSQLSKIEKCNNNVDCTFGTTTEFKMGNDSFTVYDYTSKDGEGNYKSLEYIIEDEKVEKFSVGYGKFDRERTTVSYFGEIGEKTAGEKDVVASTLLEYNDTLTVVSFSNSKMVAQCSYEKGENGGYLKPKKVLSASSNGYDPITLTNHFSDTLDIFKVGFVKDPASNSEEVFTGGWRDGSLSNDRYITGTHSFYGKNLNFYYAYGTSNSQGETMTVSLWLNVSAKTSVTVKVSRKDAEPVTYIIDNNLKNKWQFLAVNIGKVLANETISVIISSEENAYIDDFRITRAPYEIWDKTLSEISSGIYEDVFNPFGNIEKKYEYSPVDRKVACTKYVYNSDHQLTQQIVTIHDDLNDIDVMQSKIEYDYNIKGIVTAKRTYGSDENNYFEELYCYNGYVQNGILDTNYVKTTFGESIDSTYTVLQGELDSPNVLLKNTYYSDSNFLKQVSSVGFKNNLIYNQSGALSKVKYGYNSDSTDYAEISFGYDTFGNLNKVSIGSSDLVSLSYDYKHLNSLTYANGTTVSYTYDKKNRLTSITESGASAPVTFAYSDDAENKVTVTEPNGLTYQSKSINSDGKTSEYSIEFPDGYEQKLKVVGCAVNGAGNRTTFETYVGDKTTPFEKCETVVDRDGRLKEINRETHLGGGVKYYYDELYRLNEKSATYFNLGAGKVFKNKYTYESTDEPRQSMRIAKEAMQVYDSETYSSASNARDSYRYEYYGNGNLAKIYSGDILFAEYIYDEYNRLIKEKNYYLEESTVYDYDNVGNIISKKKYHITNGVIDSNPYKTDNYNYTETNSGKGQNADWRDQLKSYNGTEISYDALGNPTNYLGKEMQWRGRKLIKAGNVEMEYDYNGLRVKKGGNKYYWYNGQLKAEYVERLGRILYYYYDESGVSGMHFAGYDYYFRKNIFGDVLAIYDIGGNLQCRYVYDAWGNCKAYDKDGNEPSGGVGYFNPFRYRGYYWDRELGLYYLQSRYYDPELCRFISADDVNYLDPESITGLNLYAYCADNPVMFYDPTGNFVLSSFLTGLFIAALIGASVGAASYVASEVISYAETGVWTWSWGMFAGSVLGGAIGGALSFAFPALGVVGSAAITGGLSMAIGMGMENALGTANHSLLDILLYSTMAAGLSAAFAKVTTAIRLPGFTGRGSISQVAKQINTKFYNGTIRKITGQTFMKLFVYSSAYSVLNTIALGGIDCLENYIKLFNNS